MHILLIEDDPATAAFVTAALTAEGHMATIANNGQKGLRLGKDRPWDVLIVDRMLPVLDGVSVVRELRATGNNTPVLFLTTMDGIDDRVHGLKSGGDDYLVKPFAISELLARVTALHRRFSRSANALSLRASNLELDLLTREVRRDGVKIDLQQREVQILEIFLRNKGQIITKKMLLEAIWNFQFDPKTNLVESHISRLRSKINRDHFELIKTIRGSGYCLDD